LLSDLWDIWDATEAMHTEAILQALNELDEAPWGDLKGKPLDPRKLARFLRDYGIKPCDVRADVDGEEKSPQGLPARRPPRRMAALRARPASMHRLRPPARPRAS